MKKFEDISQEDLDLIIMVAERLAPKFIFAYWALEDIKQEAMLMGLDALSRWDKKRPLENFLHIHIRNRLNTLRRDKYYRSETGKLMGPQEIKKNLLNCVNIETCPQPTHESEPYSFDKEMIEKLEVNLPARYRGDYLRLINGGKLSPKKKSDLTYQIKLIIGKHYEDRT